jgi:hypothetical protein
LSSSQETGGVRFRSYASSIGDLLPCRMAPRQFRRSWRTRDNDLDDPRNAAAQ